VLIGTAAGLAAAFTTPIGGLLLAIEQVCVAAPARVTTFQRDCSTLMLSAHSGLRSCVATCNTPPVHCLAGVIIGMCIMLQGSSFLTISLFWRGFLATCTCTVVLHVLAFMKVCRLAKLL